MSVSDPKELTLHMIGNAHLDPVWLWDWHEGLQEALDTCWAAIDRLREDDRFIFTRSSAAIYHWIEEYDPELFAEIKRYVAEGRWEIVNGFWVQPDCNLPGGESFVRHSLYGKRYFQKHFGVEVRAGYNVDSFGHNVGLPQILKKAGFDYYVFCRPDPQEKFLPALMFNWQSPDGSQVLAYRPPLHYGAWGDALVGKILVGVLLLTAFSEAEQPLRDLALLYGVGNHGGGPTKENLATIHQFNANPQMPQVKFARLDDFLDKVAAQEHNFPLVAEDLQYHSRGCYTSHSRVKWYNRQCERALMTAERLSSLLARVAAVECSPEDFEAPWRRVLFNQFHDIMGGCSIQRAYHDVLQWYEEALQAAQERIQVALGIIGSRVDTTGVQQPYLVVNPLPWARTEAVKVAAEAPTQLVELPPLGWTVVDGAGNPPRPDIAVHVSPTSLENEYLRATLAPGALITSLVDKTTGQELLTGPANRLIVLDDKGDAWGHNIDAWRDEIGEFEPDGEGEVLPAGPVRGTVRFRLRWGDSAATVTVALAAGSRRLDFDLVLDWHEKHLMVKVAFPMALENPQATFEQSYAAISLPADGSERPAQHWIDVTGEQKGKPAGAALLNDCKYGFDVLGAEMRMTVTRSPAYTWQSSPLLEQSRHHRHLDQGEVKVNYALLPHSAGWQQAAIPREGWAFNNPPLVYPLKHNGIGELPAVGSLAEVGPDQVVSSVFKPAEEGVGTIARLYETTGQATRAWLSLPQEGQRWEFDLAPYEIKTFLLPAAGEEGELIEVNLLERPLRH